MKLWLLHRRWFFYITFIREKKRGQFWFSVIEVNLQQLPPHCIYLNKSTIYTKELYVRRHVHVWHLKRQKLFFTWCITHTTPKFKIYKVGIINFTLDVSHKPEHTRQSFPDIPSACIVHQHFGFDHPKHTLPCPEKKQPPIWSEDKILFLRSYTRLYSWEIPMAGKETLDFHKSRSSKLLRCTCRQAAKAAPLDSQPPLAAQRALKSIWKQLSPI